MYLKLSNIVRVAVFIVAIVILEVGDGAKRVVPSVSAKSTSRSQQTDNSRVHSSVYTVYLPAVRIDKLATQFSVGGVGTREQVSQVVPRSSQIDPYIWDVLPHQESVIQVIRSCIYYRVKATINDQGGWRWVHADWYQNNRVGHLCWDPLTTRVAQIVDSDRCQYGLGRPCLDVSADSILNAGEVQFRELVRNNPHWIWLVGNEPDGLSQDGLVDSIDVTINGTSVQPVHIGGPEAYARFFRHIYQLVNAESPTPKLVFCQATFAHARQANYGLNYCQQAYNHLKSFGYGPTHIFALSTHQYVHDAELFNGIEYKGGELLDGSTYPFGAGKTVLELAVDRWISYLEEFAAWAASEGLGDKPLWLTEYGSLAAWCFEVQAHTNFESGGVACPQADNGEFMYPFYGRNSREGIWGLQKLQMEYLARTDNQWQAGWWFVSTMGWGIGSCYQTGWLWRADFDCEAQSPRVNNLSRAGETHQQVLDCMFNQQNCPTAGQRGNVQPQPVQSANTSVPDPQCKSFGDFICPNEFE